MLDFIRSIREGLKDPKKRAITKLCLYGIFFIIVFILINNSSRLNNGINNNNIEPTPTKKEYSYNYIYDINTNNTINHITGKSFDENDFYSYDKMKALIDKCEFIESNTYKDESGNKITKTTYNIKASDYYDECTGNCDSIITVTTYEKEFIYNVIIDLTSVTNYPYVINIEFENLVSK